MAASAMPAMRAQRAEGGRARLPRRLRDPVHLDAIAGGEDHQLGGHPARGERGEHLAELVLLEGERLPHLDGRAPVAHPRHEERGASCAVSPLEEHARPQGEQQECQKPAMAK